MTQQQWQQPNQPWGNSSGGAAPQGAGWQQPAQQSQGWGQQQAWGQPQGQQWGNQQSWGQGQWGQQGSAYGSALQPQWGQQQGQQGGQGQWGAPPPPKASPLPKLLLAGLGVLVAVVIGVIAINSLKGGGDDGIAYQNEDYKVPAIDTSPPDIVIPQSDAELTKLLEDNPLYQQSVPRPVRCDMQPIDLTQASEGQIEEHLNDLTACLMRVWAVPMEKAGWVPVRFKANIYGSQPIQTPCGKIPAKNAVFCAANQQMYYSTSLPLILPPALRDQPYVVETVLAHEFGHGIQARTGIFAASILAGRDAGSKSATLQYNRRAEVQADCFAGQFIGSIAQSKGLTQTDVDNIKKLMVAIGDDTLTGKPDYEGDHGLSTSRVYWMQMGMASTNIGACNTYVAPPEKVR